MTVGEIPQEAIVAELDDGILLCWYNLLPSKTPTWWSLEYVGNQYPIYVSDADRSLKKGLVCFVQKPTTYPEVGWYKGKAVCLFSEIPLGTICGWPRNSPTRFKKTIGEYDQRGGYLAYVFKWPDGTEPQQDTSGKLNGRPIDLLRNVKGSDWEKIEDTVVYIDTVPKSDPNLDKCPVCHYPVYLHQQDSGCQAPYSKEKLFCPICKFPVDLHIGKSTCVAPHYPLLLINPSGDIEKAVSLEQWNELKQQRQYADYKVEPSVTVDEHHNLGEKCKICETTYQDCTDDLLHDQRPCCSTCKNIDTHNANAYRNRFDKEEDLFSAPVGTYVVKFSSRGKYHVVDGDKTGCGLSVTSTDLKDCDKSISTKVPNDRICGNCFYTK